MFCGKNIHNIQIFFSLQDEEIAREKQLEEDEEIARELARQEGEKLDREEDEPKSTSKMKKVLICFKSINGSIVESFFLFSV